MIRRFIRRITRILDVGGHFRLRPRNIPIPIETSETLRTHYYCHLARQLGLLRPLGEEAVSPEEDAPMSPEDPLLFIATVLTVDDQPDICL